MTPHDLAQPFLAKGLEDEALLRLRAAASAGPHQQRAAPSVADNFNPATVRGGPSERPMTDRAAEKASRRIAVG